MQISFNIRLGYEQVIDCSKYIRSISGEGGVTAGGSWFEGTQDQIDKLLIYMGKKGYNMDSMNIDKYPNEVTKEIVAELKKDGVIA